MEGKGGHKPVKKTRDVKTTKDVKTIINDNDANTNMFIDCQAIL